MRWRSARARVRRNRSFDGNADGPPTKAINATDQRASARPARRSTLRIRTTAAGATESLDKADNRSGDPALPTRSPTSGRAHFPASGNARLSSALGALLPQPSAPPHARLANAGSRHGAAASIVLALNLKRVLRCVRTIAMVVRSTSEGTSPMATERSSRRSSALGAPLAIACVKGRSRSLPRAPSLVCPAV